MLHCVLHVLLPELQTIGRHNWKQLAFVAPEFLSSP
jgi:hypothetical protein